MCKDRGESGKGSLVPVEEGDTGGAEVPRTMAEAVTYADLRFVKAPLKKSISNQLGQGKGWLSISLILHPHPLHDPTPPHRLSFLTPILAPFLSSPDPEADEDGDLTYENVQVPSVSGVPLSLASSGLGDKTGMKSPRMCVCVGGVS